ncbi:hypothetical protein CYMTET_51241 [Cymbomonas tetramitiformis]|uniref:Uncharacterized protein n=1 Tax=Cymbomonas tetramitiformis TaxID=36881 RepID=A0AAE0ESL4_9CHLO|nr:hypothetical protein CYMTET_51241 [Cymbomonas tetramitiformis]
MRRKLSKCRALYPSQKLMNFVQEYWEENKPGNIVARRAKLSAGFFGIVLAINICGSVDIYGFGDNSRHEGGGNYFNKSKGSRGWKTLSLCVHIPPTSVCILSAACAWIKRCIGLRDAGTCSLQENCSAGLSFHCT